MAKVTSKLQVTIPKALAEQLRVKAGDEIDWSGTGDAIRITRTRSGDDISTSGKLKLFDEATARHRRRQRKRPASKRTAQRGWSREDLYDRGRPR